MKKSVIFFIVACVIFNSCTSQYRTTGKDYLQKIYWRSSDVSCDGLFDNTVQYLANLNFDIKQIDRKSKTIRVKGLEQLSLTSKDSVIVGNKNFNYPLSTTLIILVQPTENGSRIGGNLFVFS